MVMFQGKGLSVRFSSPSPSTLFQLRLAHNTKITDLVHPIHDNQTKHDYQTEHDYETVEIGTISLS